MQTTFTILKTKKLGMEVYAVLFAGRLIATRMSEAGARTVALENKADNIVVIEA